MRRNDLEPGSNLDKYSLRKEMRGKQNTEDLRVHRLRGDSVRSTERQEGEQHIL